MLLLARRLGLPVAGVLVRAEARDGSRVRVLADGRRMLGEVWTVRRGLNPDHPSRRRPMRSRRPRALAVASVLLAVLAIL